jgi:hypothetical protein
LLGNCGGKKDLIKAEEERMGKIQLFFVLAILVSGCTAPREGTAGKTTPDVLTAQEIATTDALNAFDAVSLKRPFWLKSRGTRSLLGSLPGQTSEFPVVYIDSNYYGELESLRNIFVTNIREINYFDFNAANLRFGTGHTGGVIQVLTKN